MGAIRGSEQAFTLTRLANGKVLAAGGSGALASAEVYDPATGVWSATGSMATARSGHSATLLQNGKVLVVGGNNGSYLASAELYDPATGSWSPTGPLAVARFAHTATLLNNDKVLVAAGHNGIPIASAELYDPATGTWSPTSPMAVSRYIHRGVLLADGRVLIAGGTGGAAPNSVEIYDPATGTWSSAAAMITGRWNSYTLTLLANGRVLAAGGGINWTAIATAQAEIYDPATAIWSATAAMPTTRNGHTATLLGDGRVLVAAGNDHPVDFGAGTNINTAIIYDPVAASWSPTANTLGGVRVNHLALGLLDGRVLVAGGSNSSGAIASAEVYGTPSQPDLQISGQIAFSSTRDSNDEIYVMNADGTNQTRLTNNSAFDNSPSWSPDGTKIAFYSDRDGQYEIYVMDANGTNQTRLTNNPAFDYLPSWSPDGAKIVFSSNRDGNLEIYAMNADGTNQTRLTNNPANDDSPSWSPDGTKIAFESHRDGNQEIYAMNADGTNQTRLTTNSFDDDRPSWSPDGTKIAFDSVRDGNPEIYTMNADGTGMVRLTNNPAIDILPSWSPDGTKVVFRSSRDGNDEIYVMNADGTNPVNRTNNSAAENGGERPWTPFQRIGSALVGGSVFRNLTIENKGGVTLNVSNITTSDGQFTVGPTNFSVAPGGSQDVTVGFKPTSVGTKYAKLSVFSNAPDSPLVTLVVNGTATGGPDLQIRGKVFFGSNRDGNAEIYSMDADGSGVTRLTTNSVSDSGPFLSPDGTKILYGRQPNNDGHTQVFRMNTDGSGQQQITNAWNASPGAWSPDGTKVVFIDDADHNSNYEIYTMNADGSNVVRLTNVSGQDLMPRWSPDGSKIVFASQRDGNMEIYSMNPDGSSQTHLTNNSTGEYYPSWSPDGTKIFFTTDRDGNVEIYSMNSDGTNQTRLTNNSAADYNPAPSPDGTKILFVTSRDGNDELYVMNVDGSGAVRVTTETASYEREPTWATPPSIGSATTGTPVSRTMIVDNKGNGTLTVSDITSSDGQFTASPTSFSVAAGGSQSVAVTFTPTSAGTQYSTLAITSNDATSATAKLTVNGTGTAAPAADLQIRGKAFFVSNRDGNDEIYSMDADGSGAMRLTTNAEQDGWPVLSPDGTKIVYGRVVGGYWQLFTMNTDGSGQQQLTNTGAATDPTWSPDGTKICFYGNESTSGDLNLFSINADGSNLTRLTNVSGQELMPRWSPDGSKILFASDWNGNMELYTMNPDGSSQTRLTNNSTGEYYPSWSPDGTKIFFTTDRNGAQDVYSMNPDGSNQVQLTNNSAADAYPTSSPDGTKVLFSTQRDGNGELYVMEVDGSSPVRVTNTAASYEQYPSWAAHFAVGSATTGTPVSRTMTIDNEGNATLTVSNITSSDGQFVASPTSFNVAAGDSQSVTVTFTPTSTGTKYSTLTITSNDATSAMAKLIVSGTATAAPVADLQIGRPVLFNTNRDGNQELYSMNADGSNQTRLTNSSAGEVSAVYSPDGTRIVFDQDPSNNGHIQIFTMNADGSGITQLTSNWAARGPSWSPDGTKIVFFNSPDNHSYDIYTMNADGSNQTRLTTTSADEYGPNWSPNGSKIAFPSYRDGNGEIYVMNADGTDQTRLTNTSAYEGAPEWSPDGSKIVFMSYRDGSQEIYAMNANGTNQTRLTTVPSGQINDSPTWSQDGTKIMFFSNRDGNYELYSMDADGSNPTRLTTNAAADVSPRWATHFRIGSATVGSSALRGMTIENKGTATLTVSNITFGDGQFTVNPTNFSVGVGSSQNVTVTFTPTSAGVKYSALTISSNDPDNPQISLIVNGTGVGLPPKISINDASVTEGNSGTISVVFSVGLSSLSSQTVTVDYATANGTAAAGSDYVATLGSLSFAPGEQSKTITVQVNGDNVFEPTETFLVNLSNPTNATIADAQGVGTIVNDDAQPAILINDVSVTEGDGGITDAVFTVTLTNPSGQTVKVAYSTADGTALAGSDYVAQNNSLVFAPGETSKTVSIQVNGDVLNEPDETFSVNLNTPTNATIADAQGVGTILNDDPQPAISISDVSVVEGNSGTTAAVFTVSLSSASGQTVTVDFSTSDGTATVGSDYISGSGTLSFAPGEQNKTVTVLVNGDRIFEVNETFLVNLSDVTKATTADGQGVGTILNDDPQPAISIDDASVTEGNSGTISVVFSVGLSSLSSQTVTVDYATANGTAAAGSDYVATLGSLSFAPGEQSKTITVQVNGDNVFEPTETFLVNLSNPTNATIADAQGVGTIVNDDAQPSISINDVTVTEGNAETTDAVFTVTLSNPSSQAVAVNFSIAEGTGTEGSDYQVVGGTLTFASGITSQSITVQVIGDALNEADETFFANLSSASNATIDDSQGLGIIKNDDPLPSLGVNDVAVTEGNTGTVYAVFKVSLSAPSGQVVTVNFSTADGTALAGRDYAATSGMLIFNPGEASKALLVPVSGDVTHEPDENFSVNLSNPDKATVADREGVGTILNDDPQPAVSISDMIISEGDVGTTPAIFTVTLSNPSSQVVSVDLTTVDGTASSGSDYVAANSQITFDPEQITQTVAIQVVGDLLNEADETFSINLSSPGNAVILDGQAVGTILNDDPLPSLRINDVAVTEGNSSTVDAVFTVNLSAPSGQVVTVGFSTSDGTAQQGSDYAATGGTLTFALGETSKTVSIPVNGDALNEADENFYVILGSASNATIDDPKGLGTILNDDPLPKLSINDVAVTEGNSGTVNAVFTVSLSAPSGQVVTVDFSTQDNTANVGSDYVSTNGPLTFPPGVTTQTITVQVIGELANEPDESFFVNLASPSHALIADGQGVGTIRTDDHPPDCSRAAPSVAELWPPNHQMVKISILNVTDPDGDPLTITVTRITQDEPVNTYGDGDTGPDGAGLGTATAQVRSERSGTSKVPGNGRVYVISFTVSDGHPNGTCAGKVAVCVPHDQGQGKFCIDDGQKYDSVTGNLVGPAAKLATAVEEGGVGMGNYPNPFNPATTIVYSLSEASLVRLTVYNLLGQQVKVLVDDVQGMGGYAVEWDGLDEAGLAVSSGVYFYRLEAGDQVLVRKMLLSR